MSTALLDSIEARLQAHAAALDLSPAQQDRARSLAVAGAVSSLIGITPAQLYELLSSGYEEYRRRSMAGNESQVQR